jgi:hypothetical protein
LLEGVGEMVSVREAVESDSALTPSQKQALIQIYVSFISDNQEEA